MFSQLRHSAFNVLLFCQVFLLLKSTSSAAAPAPVPESTTETLEEWFHQVLHPRKGTTIQQEIQCYALPYGALGFVSHVLTYYTSVMLGFGRSPLPPFRPLKWKPYDFFNYFITACFTVTLTAFTMSSCRNSWPFMLIAFWKLTLSLSMNLIGFIRVFGGKDQETGTALWGSIIYWFGSVVGIVGLFRIVHETFAENKAVRILTLVLVGLIALGIGTVVLVVLVMSCVSDDFNFVEAVLASQISWGIAIAALVVIAVFFSDWILAAVEGNWVGVPSGNYEIVYWLYFAAKRLPMFSF